MMKNIRVLLTFYRSFFIPSMAITISCALLLWHLGLASLVYLFWFKIITSAIFYWSVDTYKRKEYFYYQNLGFSKQKVWMFSLGMDFVLLLISFFVAINRSSYA